MAAVSAPTEAVDQEPVVVEQETETEEVVETPEGAAPPETTEAAATEEPQLEIPTVEEKRYTPEEVAERERMARVEAIESDRRARQAHEGRKAAEQQRQAQEATKLREAVEVSLLKGGYAADEAVIGDLVQRLSSTRSEIGMERSVSDASMAVEMLIAPIVGDPRTRDDFTLSPAAEAYASVMGPHFQKVVDALVPQIATAARTDYVHKDEIPKLIAADRAAQAAKSREGKTELTRVDGQPSPTDNSSIAERLDRIGTLRETPADRQWWDEREASKRR